MHYGGPLRTSAFSSPIFLLVTMLILRIFVASTNGISHKFVFAQNAQTRFTAVLSGKSEIPPVNTNASGIALFQLSADGKKLIYELNVKDISHFIVAHIHQGKPAEVG